MAESSFFGEPLRRLLWSPLILAGGSSSLAAMDWLETPSAHIFKIDIPGFGREDVKVQLEEGNVLSVLAEEKQEEKQMQEAVWHLAERGRGSFSRRIALPENVRTEKIKAQVENGVLTVVVPKEHIPAKPKPRTIAVTSKL